jgi:hypothetical protein
LTSSSKSPQSSERWEIRLNKEALVCVDLDVEGRLDSYSGVDSTLLIAESIVQLGYRVGDSEGTQSGAGVFGGENVLPRGRRRCISLSSSPWICRVNAVIPPMSKSLASVSGSSMLGMGTSAAATEARNCCVGAESWETTRLFFNFRRGLGGDGSRGIWASSFCDMGSGVLGASKAEYLKPLGRVAAPEC